MTYKFSGAVVALLLSLLFLSACESKPTVLVAVPLGEHAALEKLAESWKEVSDAKMVMSPASLPGDVRREFVVEVFSNAGYDYSATLRQMAEKGLDKSNKLHKDLAELVLMPHRNQRQNMTPADIYPPGELQDVAVIERMLNTL